MIIAGLESLFMVASAFHLGGSGRGTGELSGSAKRLAVGVPLLLQGRHPVDEEVGERGPLEQHRPALG